MGTLLVGRLAGIALAASIIPFAAQAQPISGATDGPSTTIEIVMNNFQFSPNNISLHAGQHYRLHFVNHGPSGHNFTAKEFFASARIAPEDASMVHDGKIELGNGETGDIRLVPVRGVYPAKCTHLFHASLGMKGSITVM
jgi:plastocyanin